MSSVDKNQSRHLMRISNSKIPHDWTAVRMTHKNERAVLPKPGESVSQFEVQLGEGAGLGARVTPGISRTVVGADASERGHMGLHENPVEGKVSQAVLHHNCRRALPGAIHV